MADASESKTPSRRYVLITPCRNEESHVEATIRTIVGQSVPPTRWIIVDDGSTDRTPQILADAAAEHAFIKVVTRTNRGARSVGPGVIAAFYAGLERLDVEEFDYIGKVDADLEFPAEYFERVMREMEADPKLGNMSGKVYLRLDDGRLVPERMGDENAIGAAKFYRKACFEQVGGFVQHVGWDGIDGHMCRLMGWIARSEDREDLRIIHRRLMGSSQNSVWEGRKRWGRLKYYMGSAPWYMSAIFAYRLAERPYVVGSVAILLGYLEELARQGPRYEYPGFRDALRRFEWLSLTRGKRAAIEVVNAPLKR